MLEEGLSYPTQGDKWIGRFIIGAALTFFSFLILPAVFIFGYFIHILEATIAGKEEPPEWENWGNIFVDGLKGIAVTIVYSIVPFAVFGTIAVVLFGAGGAAGESGGGLIAGLGLLTLLMMFPAMFIVYYFIPAALGNMAREGTFGAAFNVEVLRDVAFNSDYLVAVLLPIIVSLVINAVTTFLAFTVIGLVFVPFVAFYGQLAIFHMFGIAFRERVNRTTTRDTAGATAV